MLFNSKHLAYLKALKGFVALMRNPDDLPSVFKIINGLRHTRAFQEMVAHMLSTPETAALITERYQGPTPNLDELAKLPEGSLGFEFAHHMREKGLQVVFYPVLDVTDDLSYIEMRLRSTHDIWHLITGFGVTAAHELGLQAFMLAQGCAPLATVLIGGGMVRSVFGEVPDGLETPRVMDQVVQGWRMGRKAKQLMAQRWETGWQRPLAEWRQELGIELPAERLQ
jgi:ubiquinone biosynthesis protein COQ4